MPNWDAMERFYVAMETAQIMDLALATVADAALRVSPEVAPQQTPPHP